MAASQLARRWAVAFVGIPLVVGALYVGGWYLGVAVAVFAGLGALEVCRLAEQKGMAPFRPVAAVGAGGLVVLAAANPTFSAFAPWALAGLGGLAAAAAVSTLALRSAKGTPLADIAITLLAVLYTGLALAYVPLLHNLPDAGRWGTITGSPWLGFWVVALPLAATWVGDSVAFFAGTAWGRAKIAPRISPNKSWVGAISGLVGSALAGILWFTLAEAHLPGMPVRSWVVAGAAGGALGLGAQSGDLVESLLKRQAGVKDSGSIFPGHGGVLDRLDALFFTLPLAYVLFWALENSG